VSCMNFHSIEISLLGSQGGTGELCSQFFDISQGHFTVARPLAIGTRRLDKIAQFNGR